MQVSLLIVEGTSRRRRPLAAAAAPAALMQQLEEERGSSKKGTRIEELFLLRSGFSQGHQQRRFSTAAGGAALGLSRACNHYVGQNNSICPVGPGGVGRMSSAGLRSRRRGQLHDDWQAPRPVCVTRWQESLLEAPISSPQGSHSAAHELRVMRNVMSQCCQVNMQGEARHRRL